MKQYYQHIKLKYNNNTCILLKHFSNQQKTLTKQKQRLNFLLSCKNSGIIPNHLQNTIITQISLQKDLERTIENFLTKIINIQIRETHLIIKETRTNIHFTEIKIKETLSKKEFIDFKERQLKTYKKMAENINTAQTLKLEKLKQKKFENIKISYNEDWFVNTTTIEFPEETKWLVSLGEKFSLPINGKNFSAIHVVADIEQSIRRIEDDREKEVARSKIANRISNFKRKITQTPTEKFIYNIYQQTEKFLKEHKNNIVITNADKGNKTVVMYKEDYKNKMNKLLEDKTTYKTIRADPTQKLQNKNNKIVTDLFKHEYIDLKLKKKLTCDAAISPRLYGLPKIHKPNTPLRPVSSSVDVPCYNLSKHIGEIIQNIISTKYNIKNSLELKQQLSIIQLEEDEILVSFDVVSLFTNIPTYLAIKNIMMEWDTIKEHTNISKPKFLDILNFCLKENNYFKYDDKYYQQTFGMPMGNPLSPTIADVILDKLLDSAIEILRNQNIEIKFIVKYVDDIFAIIKRKDESAILETLNNYHNKIQFTIEHEENNSIPFLDIKIHKNNNTLITDWYSKPTSSGRMINYLSTQPQNQKLNTALNFITKVLNLSHESFHENNIKKIKLILRRNNFPSYMIKNLLHKYQNKKNNPNLDSSMPLPSTERIFFSIAFIPNLTENKKLREILPQENIQFAHKPNLTLRSIFTNKKDKIERQQQHDVVYEITCKGNKEESCNKIYIGTTKRALSTRISEHETDIRKGKHSTALSQHSSEKQHVPDFENTKILDKEKRICTRYILESLRIQQQIKRTINTKEDVDNISSSYIIAL